MKELRIVSFLPAATEMVCALGLSDQLVGITHECDHPPEVRGKPVVVRSAVPIGTMTPREIDAAVSQRIATGGSLYEIDEALLCELAPTHILSQDLCQVCAPAIGEISRAMAALPNKPQLLSFSPTGLGEISENVLALGQAMERECAAQSLAATMHSRLTKIAELTRGAAVRPRVFCLEWTDPYYCAGHWVPEMVQIAGGIDALGNTQGISTRIAWDQIENWAPEVLIVMPCGFALAQAMQQARQLLAQPCWNDIPAVREERVFAVDANSYFARPGPRLIDGTELLAHLIHPELCDWNGPGDAFLSVSEDAADWPSPRSKCCPECGATFPCGAARGENGCWCNELPHLPADQISSSGCLCPSCLAKRTAPTRPECHLNHRTVSRD